MISLHYQFTLSLIWLSKYWQIRNLRKTVGPLRLTPYLHNIPLYLFRKEGILKLINYKTYISVISVDS